MTIWFASTSLRTLEFVYGTDVLQCKELYSALWITPFVLHIVCTFDDCIYVFYLSDLACKTKHCIVRWYIWKWYTFSKVFEKVPHGRLLWKVRFLWDQRRDGFMEGSAVEGCISDWKPVTSGVCQGLMLVPLLSVIHINDLDKNILAWLASLQMTEKWIIL